MATLFNTKISETYEGLIKTSDNGVIGAVEKNLTDGLGNASTLSIGTSTASFTGTLDLTNATVLGLSTGAVDSVNGLTGVVVLTTTNIAEGTNLYFTDARVESNSAVTLNTAKVGITTSQANAIVANTLKVSFPEAPNNGQQYARQSEGWSVVSGGGAVDSVNGQTGVVVLDTDNITEGTTNLYYTDARVDANSNVVANTAKVGITPTQANEISANTLKVGITTQQATDITNNNAKVGITTSQASDITNNNAKISFDSASSTKLNGIETGAQVNTVDSVNSLTGAVSLGLLDLDDVGVDGTNGQVLTTNGSGSFSFTTVSGGGAVDSVNGQTGTVVLDTDNINEGTTNLYYTEARVSANSSVAANTAKVGITSQQATDITTNNAKVGITTQQASDITANNAKVGITTTQADEIAANTLKTGITSQQAADITTNNAKVGITTQQATDITNNNTKISFTSTGADNYLPKWDSNTLVDSIAYSDNNKIGIGTTTPSAKLEVKGDGDAIIVINDTDNPQLIFKESDTTKGKIYSNGETLGELLFDIGTTNRMRLNSNGLSILGDNTDQGLLKLYCEASTHYVGIKGPNHSGGSTYTLQLPNALPNVANQILESNASGTLSWIATPSGGGATELNDLTDVSIGANTSALINVPAGGVGMNSFVMGVGAGNSMTTGAQGMTIIGHNAGATLTGTDYGVYIGAFAGRYQNTATTQGNVLIGYEAGQGSASATSNSYATVAIGHLALRNVTGGDRNVGIGYSALSNNTTGGTTVAIGVECGKGLTTSSNNVFMGYQAVENSNASNSVVIGHQALDTGSASNMSSSTIVGYQAARSSTAQRTTAFGYQAAYSHTSGGNSTTIGAWAGYNNTNSGDRTVVGYAAGRYCNGAGNTSLGTNALKGPVAGSSGAYNTAIGRNSLEDIGNGGFNTALGNNAGNKLDSAYYNTMLGADAGDLKISGNNCTMLGYNAQASTTTVANEITLGNSSVTALRCQVTSITSLSDKRDKTKIEDSNYGLNVIDKLKPVTFDWNTRDGAKVGIKDLGFIAQDLQEVDDENLKLVYDTNPEKLEASYGRLIPVLVKAIQELKAEIEILKS